MNTCKISFLYALAISLLVTTAEARQLECSYDYVTHKTVYKITEGILALQISSETVPDLATAKIDFLRIKVY